MTDRATALGNIAVGDIFNAECPSGAGLLCLTLSVTEHAIQARTVTTQRLYEFDRRLGRRLGGKSECVIDSVAALPADIHNILLGLDRRYRLGKDPDRFALTADEKRALVFVASFYPANQL